MTTPPHRPVSVYPPHPPRLWCGGRTHSLVVEGVGGKVRKTPDTALYSTYVRVLCVIILFIQIAITLFTPETIVLRLLVLTLFCPAVGGIFDQADGGWEECQQPGAEPVSLKITIRCLAPPPALIVEWTGAIYDRWGARFCEYSLQNRYILSFTLCTRV